MWVNGVFFEGIFDPPYDLHVHGCAPQLVRGQQHLETIYQLCIWVVAHLRSFTNCYKLFFLKTPLSRETLDLQVLPM